MAITNAQQFKQLVNPPMEGKKRPGYRGEAAAASDRDAGRDAGRDTSDAGTGNVGGDFDSASFQDAVTRGINDKRMREALEKQRKRAIAEISPSTRFGNRFLSGIISSVIPFGGLAFNKLVDQKAMGYGSTKSNIDIDDDDNGDGGNGQDNRGMMMAQRFTPFQQDVIEDELSPVQLAIQQRNLLGGPRSFAAVGGIMDLETNRQMYGLGKLVKKITRSVKKIAKSPIGKAALVGAGAFKLGGGSFQDLMRTKSLAESGFSFSKFPGASFLSDMEGKDQLALAASAGLVAAPFLFGEDDTEDEYQQFLKNRGGLGRPLDIQGIRNEPYNFLARPFKAEGGIMRVGYKEGDLTKDPNYKGWKKMYEANPDVAAMNEKHKEYLNFYERDKNKQAEGSKEPVAKKTMPLLDMGGKEMDLRAEGGFVPIGRMEKADDVPARLSKNEFVFTADAVRNAGDGNVDKGAEVMYNMMKNLESGGDVSEESQGLEGARKMFQTSQRLGEVL
jgi:hypothetical protein